MLRRHHVRTVLSPIGRVFRSCNLLLLADGLSAQRATTPLLSPHPHSFPCFRRGVFRWRAWSASTSITQLATAPCALCPTTAAIPVRKKRALPSPSKQQLVALPLKPCPLLQRWSTQLRLLQWECRSPSTIPLPRRGPQSPSELLSASSRSATVVSDAPFLLHNICASRPPAQVVDTWDRPVDLDFMSAKVICPVSDLLSCNLNVFFTVSKVSILFSLPLSHPRNCNIFIMGEIISVQGGLLDGGNGMLFKAPKTTLEEEPSVNFLIQSCSHLSPSYPLPLSRWYSSSKKKSSPFHQVAGNPLLRVRQPDGGSRPLPFLPPSFPQYVRALLQ